MVNKKSQLGMEMVMTYGAAILVVITSIGLLTYYDVLDAEKLLPEKCDTGELGCTSSLVAIDKETGKNIVQLELFNNFDDDIIIQKITLTSQQDAEDICEYTVDKQIVMGDTGLINIGMCDIGAEIGNKVKKDIKIEYVIAGSEIKRISEGEISIIVSDYNDIKDYLEQLSTECQATPEVCNGLDDNCNILVDEGLGNLTCGYGLCQGNVYKCKDGQIQTCLADSSQQQVEICDDGLDNDCDGYCDTPTDTCIASSPGDSDCFECTCSDNLCSGGELCTGCIYTTPYPEICDGIDNDCNGVIDDVLTLPLNTNQQGVCANSKKKCANANWVDDYTIVQNYEISETNCIDSLDNDCDSLIDYEEPGCQADTFTFTTSFTDSTTIASADNLVVENGQVTLIDDAPSGLLTSSNLFSGQTATIQSFSYTASSIPEGTSITVQFSQDGVNWYDSTGTLNGQDSLLEGTNSIDLSVLGWTTDSFYYRSQLTSDGTTTPIFNEIGLDYLASTSSCECSETVCRDTSNYPGEKCDGCNYLPTSSEQCQDNIDNDCDGLTDSYDTDCKKADNETCSVDIDCLSGNCIGPNFHCAPVDKECYFYSPVTWFDVGQPVEGQNICWSRCSDICTPGNYPECGVGQPYCTTDPSSSTQCRLIGTSGLWTTPCSGTTPVCDTPTGTCLCIDTPNSCGAGYYCDTGTGNCELQSCTPNEYSAECYSDVSLKKCGPQGDSWISELCPSKCEQGVCVNDCTVDYPNSFCTNSADLSQTASYALNTTVYCPGDTLCIECGGGFVKDGSPGSNFCACECTSEPCCDGCHYQLSSYLCSDNYITETGCPWGAAPGDDVGLRDKDQYCTGSNNLCDGASVWESYTVLSDCDGCAYCIPGLPDCNLYCTGADTDCGCTTCEDCNLQDGCYDDSFYREYWCGGTSCSYIADDCSDCSCDCGNYNTAEICGDSKDNNCNGFINEDCPIDASLSATTSPLPSPLYPNDAVWPETELNDGLTAGPNPDDPSWVGFTEPAFEITLDLGGITTIDSASAHFLSSTEGGIYLPQSVDIYTSIDGIIFVYAGSFTIPPDSSSPTAVWLEASFPQVSAQYLRFSITADPLSTYTLVDEVTTSSGNCDCSGFGCQPGDTGNKCDSCNYITAPSEICTDNLDNDCDGEADYDSLDGKHGDDNCAVGVSAIAVSDPNPIEDTNIDVMCTTTVANINSIEAFVDSTPCTFTSWNADTATFSCNVGAVGAKTALCNIDTTKSYKTGTDQTANIIVLDSGHCSSQTSHTEGDAINSALYLHKYSAGWTVTNCDTLDTSSCFCTIDSQNLNTVCDDYGCQEQGGTADCTDTGTDWTAETLTCGASSTFCTSNLCASEDYYCYRTNEGFFVWKKSADFVNGETACNDGYDNDCDGESDYDSLDGLHGESDCPVEVTAISVADLTPNNNFNVDVTCTSSVANINSINADLGGTPCTFSSWSGTQATFSCPTGAFGEKIATCSIDALKSYVTGAEQTDIVDVQNCDCTTGACCDGCFFKSDGDQPTGYTDDTDGFCSGVNSPTGTSFVKQRFYECNGIDADMHFTEPTADTCSTCEFCSNNDLTCNSYSFPTQGPTSDFYHVVGSNSATSTNTCNLKDYSCAGSGTSESSTDNPVVTAGFCAYISSGCTGSAIGQLSYYGTGVQGGPVTSDFYQITGTNTPSGDSKCEYNNYQCSGGSTAQINTQTTTLTAAKCRTITGCIGGSAANPVVVHNSGESCGGGQTCDSSGNCITPCSPLNGQSCSTECIVTGTYDCSENCIGEIFNTGSCGQYSQGFCQGDNCIDPCGSVTTTCSGGGTYCNGNCWYMAPSINMGCTATCSAVGKSFVGRTQDTSCKAARKLLAEIGSNRCYAWCDSPSGGEQPYIYYSGNVGCYAGSSATSSISPTIAGADGYGIISGHQSIARALCRCSG